MPWLVAPVRAIGRDADLYVERLASETPALGATLLVARHSRYVCDLNRSPSEIDRLGVIGATGVGAPHGFIWRATTDGQAVLSSPLPQLEHERRVREIWTPYHEQLRTLLAAMRREHGYAILVSLHSMPSRGKTGTPEADQPRADIVPGTRGRTTAHPAVLAATEQVAGRFGWSLRHDDPYRGGYTTAQYGHPPQGIHAIQIELSRGRYLDEQRLTLLPNWVEAQHVCSELILQLSRLSAASLGAGSAKTPG
jgi:N-formylglutamate deformylase